MIALPSNRVARRRTIAFGTLVMISLLLMAASSTGPVVELQRGVAFALRPIQGVLDGAARNVVAIVQTVTEIDTLHSVNEKLARENARLSAENARAQEIERQNTLLTALLQVRNSLKFQSVAGSVIGREPSQFRRVVILDVGTDRGVAVGNVVVGEGGALVGRVTATTANSATVLLIDDTSSTAIGQLGTSKATGPVVGPVVGDLLVMGSIDSTDRIQIGDQVVTAGIVLAGGVRSPFPKGLLIGTVVDVQRDANAVTQTAFIQPTVNLNQLEYALVITDYAGGLPPLDQQPIPCASAGTLPEGEQPCVTTTPAATPRPTP